MDTKWIGRSMTIWGMIITVTSTAGPVLAPLIGGEVNPGEIAELGTTGTAWLNATGAFVGSILTVVGRFRAKTPVTILPTA